MLRLLEHYASPQGEGPHVGIMSQFVRFAGCNLKCPGWPCDTPYAIDPKLYRNEEKRLKWEEVAAQILLMYAETGAHNVVFTGGEPLLQNQHELQFVINSIEDTLGIFTWEVFTNGTRPIPRGLIESCTFVMDWKLGGSGEDPLNEERILNIDRLIDGPLPQENAIKFVVKNADDLVQSLKLYDEFVSHRAIETYVGVAWGSKDIDNELVVNFIKMHKLNWRLNVQVQNYVFGAHVRGT